MSAEENAWMRPASVPIPTIWSIYESSKPMAKGIRPRFRIQDFTEEWREAVIDNVVKYFLRDEPFSNSLDFLSCPSSINGYLSLANKFLDQKMVLIAIVENWDELGEENLPKLAGLNLTGVIRSTDKDEEEGTEKIKVILEALEYLKSLNDPFKYFGVTELLYSVGLSVDPTYRGHNLGYEILKCRFKFCKALGIPATVTAFTSFISQRQAEKLGFETLSEVKYDDYKNEKGEVIFKIKTTKSMKLMGIRIP